ncbi:protein LIKE COV 1-like isoform X1 [Rutidosis leptorrhynchoides]|uniref:protein LIKE COV 1-like isoform X1 n=1 Tax=Rutidosis leptorrhynchoides TaxID=125765 RepID=UPI003A99991E
MADGKSPSNRDRELLIPVANTAADDDRASPKPSPSSSSSSHNAGRETFSKVIRSWASKKFMTGCVILLPIAITFYITFWFIDFVDGFFSPIYAQLSIDIFGLGFITSILFIFLVGVFMSSWLGASVLGLGEWFIKRMPFIRHIYNASKQISAAISPDQNTQAFKEVAIIRHPRIGEYAFGFITSSVILQGTKSYIQYMSRQTIFILAISSWSTQRMLSDQTYLFVKESKLWSQEACLCRKYYQHWIQVLMMTDQEITEIENTCKCWMIVE